MSVYKREDSKYRNLGSKCPEKQICYHKADSLGLIKVLEGDYCNVFISGFEPF